MNKKDRDLLLKTFEEKIKPLLYNDSLRVLFKDIDNVKQLWSTVFNLILELMEKEGTKFTSSSNTDFSELFDDDDDDYYYEDEPDVIHVKIPVPGTDNVVETYIDYNEAKEQKKKIKKS